MQPPSYIPAKSQLNMDGRSSLILSTQPSSSIYAESQSNLGSRPKGSTIEAKKDLERRKKLAKDLMSIKLEIHGLFKEIHQEALKQYPLEEADSNIQKSTIDRHLQRDSLVVTSFGTKKKDMALK